VESTTDTQIQEKGFSVELYRMGEQAARDGYYDPPPAFKGNKANKNHDAWMAGHEKELARMRGEL
jgi:hypothetical protein